MKHYRLNMPHEPAYMSLTEIAARLGCSRRTVRRWYDAGTLPAPVPIMPGKLMFDTAEVEAWIKSRREPLK